MRRFFTLGFTMIELMITLAIVAVLAAAVMAALNPIEQTDRARDAKMFAAGVDVVKAIERYNTLTDSYPFTDSDDFYVGGSHVAPILNTLVTQEQLSQGLADYVADNVTSYGVHIFKPVAGLGAPVYMCFTPRSIQRQADVNNNGQICGPETVETCVCSDSAYLTEEECVAAGETWTCP